MRTFCVRLEKVRPDQARGSDSVISPRGTRCPAPRIVPGRAVQYMRPPRGRIRQRAIGWGRAGSGLRLNSRPPGTLAFPQPTTYKKRCERRRSAAHITGDMRRGGNFDHGRRLVGLLISNSGQSANVTMLKNDPFFLGMTPFFLW